MLSRALQEGHMSGPHACCIWCIARAPPDVLVLCGCCADAAGVGMQQGDLVRWFVAQQNEAGGFDSIQELLSEYRLVRRIIQVSH